MLVELERLRALHSEVPTPTLVYPPDLPIDDITTWDTYTPVATEPAHLTPFTNSLGNTVTRVTDYTVQGTGLNLRHHYSKDQPWNSDGTLIKLAISSSTYILDGNDYSVKFTRPIPGAATWSHSDPDLLYYVSGNNVGTFKISTSTSTVLRTFTGYSNLSYGENEGNTSTNDRYIGLQGTIGTDNYLIVYDIINDTDVSVNVGANKPDWFSVSQSGLYAVANYAPDGSGVNQGVKVYDIDLTNMRHLVNKSSHSDLGIDQDGNEVIVYFSKSGGDASIDNDYMQMCRLSDGVITPLAQYTVSSSVLYGGHISCRNTDRPGWAYVTEASGSDRSRNELVAIKLDGSNTVERFGWHRASDQVYARQPHGVPNRNGTRIMYTSDWDNNFNSSNGYTEGYRPCWVVEVPQL